MSEGAYQDAVNWQPDRPCRPEVAATIAFIRDALTAEGLPFAAEQDDMENPDCWSIACRDADGYENLALVSWNGERGGVVFAGLKPEVARRDQLEGVSEDESKSWWMPSDTRMCVQLLTGDVRRIMAREMARRLRVLDGGGSTGVGEIAA